MKRTGLWIALSAAVFIGLLAYMTLSSRNYRVEVCLEFHGRSNCRTASAATREAAQRTAHDNACALLSSGVTDSLACGRTPPTKVTWLESN